MIDFHQYLIYNNYLINKLLLNYRLYIFGKGRAAGRAGSGQTFCQQSRVGSGQRFAGSGRVGSKKSDPWTTLILHGGYLDRFVFNRQLELYVHSSSHRAFKAPQRLVSRVTITINYIDNLATSRLAKSLNSKYGTLWQVFIVNQINLELIVLMLRISSSLKCYVISIAIDISIVNELEITELSISDLTRSVTDDLN